MYEAQPEEASCYASRQHLVFVALMSSLPSNVIEMINATFEMDERRYHYHPPILCNHSGGFVSQKWRSL